jgi:hypothetical protein
MPSGVSPRVTILVSAASCPAWAMIWSLLTGLTVRMAETRERLRSRERGPRPCAETPHRLPARGSCRSRRSCRGKHERKDGFALAQVADSPDKAHTRRVTPSEDAHCGLPHLRHEKSPLNFEAFNGPGTVGDRTPRDPTWANLAAIQPGNLTGQRARRRRSGWRPAPSQRQSPRRARRAAARRRPPEGKALSRRLGFRASTCRRCGRRPWR